MSYFFTSSSPLFVFFQFTFLCTLQDQEESMYKIIVDLGVASEEEQAR
jgi:hypothetical protein